MADTSRQLRKNHIISVRREFFGDLLKEWSRPPEIVDEVMGQSSYFIAPDDGPNAVRINDPERGLLLQSFTPPEGWGKDIQFMYSIWVAGDWIRYGIMIHGAATLLSVFSSRNESTEKLERVWDSTANFMTREGGLLLEWRSENPHFYDDYIFADRYLQIARHLHFQLGHSIHEAFADVTFGPHGQ